MDTKRKANREWTRIGKKDEPQIYADRVSPWSAASLARPT
jgi:hypothetical protein